MQREMLQGKLHRACVSECHLDYPGSLTVDVELLEAANILVGQKIQVVNLNNGSPLETYTIPGERGKRQIIVNGAAARLAQPGDRIIIIAYALYDEAELADYRSQTIVLDEHNEIIERH